MIGWPPGVQNDEWLSIVLADDLHPRAGENV